MSTLPTQHNPCHFLMPLSSSGLLTYPPGFNSLHMVLSGRKSLRQTPRPRIIPSTRSLVHSIPPRPPQCFALVLRHTMDQLHLRTEINAHNRSNSSHTIFQQRGQFRRSLHPPGTYVTLPADWIAPQARRRLGRRRRTDAKTKAITNNKQAQRSTHTVTRTKTRPVNKTTRSITNKTQTVLINSQQSPWTVLGFFLASFGMVFGINFNLGLGTALGLFLAFGVYCA